MAAGIGTLLPWLSLRFWAGGERGPEVAHLMRLPQRVQLDIAGGPPKDHPSHIGARGGFDDE